LSQAIGNAFKDPLCLDLNPKPQLNVFPPGALVIKIHGLCNAIADDFEANLLKHFLTYQWH
jgi:hypothetical protein